ncbi:MAG: GntR family transcriptional regulator [Bacteroidaceae bacterium]|nr:GntR family transcriptional regulator [Bacteroidaceae bacterium]
MDFENNKPIYLQITDLICDRILSGDLKPEDRIASVRELGAEYQVNPNTVARSYEKLTADGIIFNKRGIGFFISDDAYDKVLEQKRDEFINNEVPRLRRRMELLGLNPSDIF